MRFLANVCMLIFALGMSATPSLAGDTYTLKDRNGITQERWERRGGWMRDEYIARFDRDGRRVGTIESLNGRGLGIAKDRNGRTQGVIVCGAACTRPDPHR
jgi:hypothetical protein